MLKVLRFHRSNLTSRAQDIWGKKKKKKTNAGRPTSGSGRRPSYLQKLELVCAIRIRSITDNLGRSRPFSPSDGMFCILRRCRISFALSEDRPPPSPRTRREARTGGKEGKKGGGRHERHKRAIPPLKSVVIHGPVLRGKKNTSPLHDKTTDASGVALQWTRTENPRERV